MCAASGSSYSKLFPCCCSNPSWAFLSLSWAYMFNSFRDHLKCFPHKLLTFLAYSLSIWTTNRHFSKYFPRSDHTIKMMMFESWLVRKQCITLRFHACARSFVRSMNMLLHFVNFMNFNAYLIVWLHFTVLPSVHWILLITFSCLNKCCSSCNQAHF